MPARFRDPAVAARTFLQIKRAGKGQSSINAIVKKINKSKPLLIKPDLLEISQWRSD
jgi:hypothetical protein